MKLTRRYKTRNFKVLAGMIGALKLILRGPFQRKLLYKRQVLLLQRYETKWKCAASVRVGKLQYPACLTHTNIGSLDTSLAYLRLRGKPQRVALHCIKYHIILGTPLLSQVKYKL